MTLLAVSCAANAHDLPTPPEPAGAVQIQDAGSPDLLKRELDRLESSSSAERRDAATRLSDFPAPSTRGALEGRLDREEDPEVREAIQRSLSKAEP